VRNSHLIQDKDYRSSEWNFLRLLLLWYLLQGYGSFSGYIMSMYVLYLLQCRRINGVMSSYQVARNTWNNLGEFTVWYFVNTSCLHNYFYRFVPSHFNCLYRLSYAMWRHVRTLYTPFLTFRWPCIVINSYNKTN